MNNRKKIVGLGFLTYLLGIIIFLLVSYLVFIVTPKHEDWELFTFNMFGCLLIYGAAIIPYLMFFLLTNFKKIKNYLVIIVLILSIELVSLVITQESIIISILTTMVTDKNYILIAYPLVIVFSYIISKRFLNVKFL
ncbi:hypothetical protein [Aquimarina spinulae]|uniref:hypothetical protein n=1 Tax=Aquimarina spinulae TaxID=1192023 RepID=UPI000D54F961|nr:hypothetical protein [Aquimarina spinulae]